MKANFTIDADRARRMLRTRMTGLFGLGDVDAFVARLRAGVRELGRDRHGHVTLNNVSECCVLPQPVLAAFEAIAKSSKHPARRVAFVTNSALARLQVQRVFGGDHVRLFADEEAAITWLMESETVQPIGCDPGDSQRSPPSAAEPMAPTAPPSASGLFPKLPRTTSLNHLPR